MESVVKDVKVKEKTLVKPQLLNYSPISGKKDSYYAGKQLSSLKRFTEKLINFWKFLKKREKEKEKEKSEKLIKANLKIDKNRAAKVRSKDIVNFKKFLFNNLVSKRKNRPFVTEELDDELFSSDMIISALEPRTASNSIKSENSKVSIAPKFIHKTSVGREQNQGDRPEVALQLRKRIPQSYVGHKSPGASQADFEKEMAPLQVLAAVKEKAESYKKFSEIRADPSIAPTEQSYLNFMLKNEKQFDKEPLTLDDSDLLYSPSDPPLLKEDAISLGESEPQLSIFDSASLAENLDYKFKADQLKPQRQPLEQQEIFLLPNTKSPTDNTANTIPQPETIDCPPNMVPVYMIQSSPTRMLLELSKSYEDLFYIPQNYYNKYVNDLNSILAGDKYFDRVILFDRDKMRNRVNNVNYLNEKSYVIVHKKDLSEILRHAGDNSRRLLSENTKNAENNNYSALFSPGKMRTLDNLSLCAPISKTSINSFSSYVLSPVYAACIMLPILVIILYFIYRYIMRKCYNIAVPTPKIAEEMDLKKLENAESGSESLACCCGAAQSFAGEPNSSCRSPLHCCKSGGICRGVQSPSKKVVGTASDFFLEPCMNSSIFISSASNIYPFAFPSYYFDEAMLSSTDAFSTVGSDSCGDSNLKRSKNCCFLSNNTGCFKNNCCCSDDTISSLTTTSYMCDFDHINVERDRSTNFSVLSLEAEDNCSTQNDGTPQNCRIQKYYAKRSFFRSNTDSFNYTI